MLWTYNNNIYFQEKQNVELYKSNIPETDTYTIVNTEQTEMVAK